MTLFPCEGVDNSYRCRRYNCARKDCDIMEYLDPDKDSTVPISATSHSRMHLQSAYNCYCKETIPICCQRDEIRKSRRDRITVVSKSSRSKTEADRRKNGKLIDTKRSSTLSPPTPILSPETSNALESAERIAKDAQIQLTEMSTTSYCNRLRRSQNMNLDVPPIDDTDDQLLYIRERVLFKFQEVNNWTNKYFTSNNQEFVPSHNVNVPMTNAIDLSSPKFKTSKRHAEFSDNGKLRIQKCVTPIEKLDDEEWRVVDFPTDVSNTKKTEEHRLPFKCNTHEDDRMQKIDNLSIQVGPPVNIERELMAHNLEHIHISPDPFFIPENVNVATYNFNHDFIGKSTLPTRKEKIVRITEEFYNADDEMKIVNEKLCGKEDKMDQGRRTIVEEEGKLESLISKDIKVVEDERKSTNHIELELQKPIDKIASKIDDNAKVEAYENTNPKELKLEREQLYCVEQIRNEDDQRKEKEESKSKEETNTVLPKQEGPIKKIVQLEEYNINRKEVEASSVSCSQRFKVSPECKSISSLRKKEKEEREKEERYKLINQRFKNILKSYCNYDKETLETYDNIKLLKMDSSLSSGETENLEEDLYHPATDELDTLLNAYNKILDSVKKGEKAIEKFLSRPELAAYSGLGYDKRTGSSTSFSSTSLDRNMGESRKMNPLHRLPNRNVKSRAKDLISRDKLAFRNKVVQVDKDEHMGNMKKVHLKDPLSTKKTNNIDRKRKCIVSMNVNTCVTHSEPTTVKRGISMSELQNKSSEETKESSINSNANDNPRMRVRDTKVIHPTKEFNHNESHLLEEVNSSGVTSSTNHLSFSGGVNENTDGEDMCHTISMSSMNDVENEVINLKSKVASTKTFCNSKDPNLQNINCDCTSLCDITKLDAFKRIFSKSDNSKEIMKHLLAYVLQDTRQNMQHKVKSLYEETDNVAANEVFKDLQEIARNSKIQSLELSVLTNLLASNGTSETMQSMLEIDMGSGNKSDKKREDDNLEVAHFEIHNVNGKSQTLQYAGKVTEHTSNKMEEDSMPCNQSIKTSKNHSTRECEQNGCNSKNEDSKCVNKTNGGSSDDESLREISNIKSDGEDGGNTSVEKSLQSEIQERNEDNCNSLINFADNKDKPTNEKNHVSTDVSKNVTGYVNEEDHACTKNNGSKTSRIIATSESDKENFSLSDLAQSKTETIGKVVFEIYNSPLQTSAIAETLQACMPPQLDTASKTTEEISTKKKTTESVTISSHELHTGQQDTLENIVCENEIKSNKNLCYDDVFKKEEIVDKAATVEMHEHIRKNILSSTYNTNILSAVSNSHGPFNGTSDTESKKTETLSDASCSEGELYMASSCSLSLGEVRILKRNNIGASSAIISDNSTTVFITKSILSAKNESSTSQIESVGEI